jgi:hypothetical protein
MIEDTSTGESESEVVTGSSFSEFYRRVAGRPSVEALRELLPIVAIDPGETTGLAILRSLGGDGNRDGDDIHQIQINTRIMQWGAERLHTLIHHHRPKIVIVESYRIYSWRTKEHTWSSLYTPRLIGGIEFLCFQYCIPLVSQSAQQGKSFVTDARLKEWGLYMAGAPHARDATRHLLTYLLFGKIPP